MFEWLRPDVELVHDLSPADWIVWTLEPWGRDGARLASFMPDGFECYARIFHPFEIWDGKTTTYLRWSDVASERGVSIAPETWAEQVAGEGWESLGGNHPVEGEIPDAVCASLVEILAEETGTPGTCWFALWSGWGGILGNSSRIVSYLTHPGPSSKEQKQRQRVQRREEALLHATPQIEHYASTGRSYLLVRGPIDAACSFEPMPGYRGIYPSFWWPKVHTSKIKWYALNRARRKIHPGTPGTRPNC